ncbi:senescence/dehydration-associated protein At3g51250-like isoform X1 [Quercus suber]|uniref:senescence/dehydration-associated protein At3g51250-like isoform X1 n=1 Tax=Quercus suber TaxID=58331 RepID=UPI0032DE652A
MIEKVATGVLSGVVKVSRFLTGSVANSRVGKKFFGLLPGEIVLASLDGFSFKGFFKDWVPSVGTTSWISVEKIDELQDTNLSQGKKRDELMDAK